MRAVGLTVILLAALGGCKVSIGDQANHAPVTQAEAEKIAEQAEANFTTGDVNAVQIAELLGRKHLQKAA